MKFWYAVINYNSIDVDFEELFYIIKERLLEDDPETSTYEVYIEFIDNIQYYINSIYKVNDFEEDGNEGNVEDLIIEFEKWLKENFGENWDEI